MRIKNGGTSQRQERSKLLLMEMEALDLEQMDKQSMVK
jgi:hypothetical protein